MQLYALWSEVLSMLCKLLTKDRHFSQGIIRKYLALYVKKSLE